MVTGCCVWQAGSVQVRVRRDADEQMVLAHVYHRLSNLVPVLTVHIFKDDWMTKSTNYVLGERVQSPPFYPKPLADVMPPPLMTSTPANTPSKPYIPQPAYNPQTYALSKTPPTATLPIRSATAGVRSTDQSSVNTSHLNPQILSLLGSPKAAADQSKF